MDTKEPTTAKNFKHGVKPENEPIVDALEQWAEAAAEKESRSSLVFQVTETNGELAASSHINGNGQHLALAIIACMNHCAPDNQVGQILRSAAVTSLKELGLIEPNQCDGQATKQPEPTNNEHE